MAPVKKAGEGIATPSLSDVVQTLAPRRARLDEYDLLILDAIKGVEEKLRAHISTRVSTIIDTSEAPGDETWVEQLTFGKWDGKWQLLIETGDLELPSQMKTQPLATAAREMRVRVFTDGLLEKLIRDAGKQLDEQVQEREKALKVANNLIAALVADGVPF